MVVQDYVVLDIEATGLNPKLEKIIEIGAARVRDGKVVDTYLTYINPGRSLTQRVSELTGICDDDLKDSPFIEEKIAGFIGFTGDDVLLGHNLIFDFSFLKKAAVNSKLVFEKKGIDTLRIARRFVTETDSKRLGDLCRYYNIHLEAHRALNDAIATHELYQKLVENYAAKEEALFEPKQLIYSVKKEGPVTPRQKEFLKGLCAQYHIPVENNNILLAQKDVAIKGYSDIISIERLTKNEASRLSDNLRSFFASR